MAERALSARWWLGLAEGDLAGARALASRDACPPRLAAYLAHQAAEKALKAAHVAGGTTPERTHDLVGLRERAPASLRDALPKAALQRLGAAEVVGRYPDGESELVDRPAADAIVADAAHVVAVIRSVLAHLVPEVDAIDVR